MLRFKVRGPPVLLKQYLAIFVYLKLFMHTTACRVLRDNFIFFDFDVSMNKSPAKIAILIPHKPPRSRSSRLSLFNAIHASTA
jgi:hypothetical protein